MKPYYLECDCTSDNHIVVFRYDEDDKTLYISTQLSPHVGFLRRIVLAFKYLIGNQPDFGHWQETVVNKSKLKDLKDLLTDASQSHPVSKF